MGARATVASLALAVALSPALARAGDAPHPSLAGTWQLNEKESDNPRDVMRRGGMGGPGMGGPRMGGPGGMGGVGGPGSWGGERGGFGRQGGPPGEGHGGPGVPRGASRLTISEKGTDLVVSRDQGDERVIHADGEARSEQDPRGQAVEVRATWKGDTLRVERKGERGTATETWQLEKGGERLKVTASFGGGMSLRRVYDRVPAESASPESAPSPASGQDAPPPPPPQR